MGSGRVVSNVMCVPRTVKQYCCNRFVLERGSLMVFAADESFVSHDSIEHRKHNSDG